MLYYIYKIENLINHKTYIGRSRHSSIKRDIKYYGSGPLIKKAIKKYGKENFRKTIIVDNVKNFDQILQYEENIIKLYKRHNKANYNLMESSYGNTPEYLNFSGMTHTDEYRKMMSKKIKEYRKTHKIVFTEERKKKYSEWSKKHSNFLYNNPSVKGMKWYTNGENDIFISPNQTVPNGYVEGRSKTKGRIPWNKGIIFKPKIQKYTQEEIQQRVWMRGKTPWCKGLTISDNRIKALTNKSKLTKIKNQSAKGYKNSNARIYLLLSPAGEKYYVSGQLKEFALQHNLSYIILRRHINKGIIEKSKYTRKENKNTKYLNTIGWTIIFVDFCRNNKGV